MKTVLARSSRPSIILTSGRQEMRRYAGRHFADVAGVFNAQIFRAPHGTPFQYSNDPDIPRVASVVRRHAVVIGWTFGGSSQLDWDCDTSVQCVLNNYLSYFSGGSSGIPLMHAVRGGTAGELSLPSTKLLLAALAQSQSKRLCSKLMPGHVQGFNGASAIPSLAAPGTAAAPWVRLVYF